MNRLLPWLALACTLACGEPRDPADGDAGAPDATTVTPGPPPGWSDALALPRAVDRDPDPHVVEIDLEARVAPIELTPGKTAEMWTYNGEVPGPLIEANVGDTVKVHFTNHLAESTTIHWHGVRVPNDMDGSPDVVPPVEPGGHFDYTFTVRDPGTYWYHPHMRSNVQLTRGLYGALVVHDPSEPPLGDELIAVLDDLEVEPDGTLTPPGSGGHLGDVFGREGNLLLVNGHAQPTLVARSGRPQRWRIVNAANARYFRLRLPGAMFRVGSDGGLIGAPERIDEILVVPGQRTEVLWYPSGAPGSEATIQWLPFDRGYWTDRRDPEDLMRIRIADLPPETPDPPPSRLRAIDPIPTDGATPQPVRLTQKTVDGKVVMGINDISYQEGGAMLMGRVGETQVWTVENTTDASHPFHLHGFFFQPLDDAGHAIPEWHDTLDIPYHQTRRFVVTYDDRPGMWMLHCHILDHAELGMMGHLMIEE
jgi:FtsP/CotA-like multicopper oxidase with cupredoxin domain